MLAASPLGKIPYLSTQQGCLCGSQVILEYLEAVHPAPPLLPRDPFAAAKVRELVTFLDWHLEMAARQLYGVAFFGAPPLSESNAGRIRREIEQKIASAAPAEAHLTPRQRQLLMADCCAFNNLPLMGMDQGGLRRGPAAGPRRRLQALPQVHRRAAVRAKGGGRPQGGAGEAMSRRAAPRLIAPQRVARRVVQ